MLGPTINKKLVQHAHLLQGQYSEVALVHTLELYLDEILCSSSGLSSAKYNEVKVFKKNSKIKSL